jgi:hypothetical protein
MAKFKLTGMLLAPCKEGYEDFETKRDYYALQQAIIEGDVAFAKKLFAKYVLRKPFESDCYEDIDINSDDAFSADRSGVYMYSRVSAEDILKSMTLQECIDMWNESTDRFHQLSKMQPMENEEWWNHLAKELGAWDMMHFLWKSGENFNDSDMYFVYVEDGCTFFSFSTKQELMELMGEFYIDEIINRR